MNAPTTGAKSTYLSRFTDFNGENAHEMLMKKVK
jgi:hypothetical protein